MSPSVLFMKIDKINLIVKLIIHWQMQGISCADVADICVKALHDSTARNKSFDVGAILYIYIYMLSAPKLTYETKLDHYFLKVCYEYVAEQGKELYELVIRIHL